jgi:hypothetical protein
MRAERADRVHVGLNTMNGRIDVRLVTCAHVIVPDPDLPLFATGLRRKGVRVDVADWRDPNVDWSAATVTVIRSPWDYISAYDEFIAWIRSTGAQTGLWNPPALLEWNTHKAYLLDLGERGAPVVPTVVLLAQSAAALAGIADAQGWNSVVVKPAVGSGAGGAGKFEVGDPRGQDHLDALLATGDALVQPYVAGIEAEGEVSVILFDGEVSHAIRKVPTGGDYRVQEQWGGRNELLEPSAALTELATRVCSVLPAPTLYARVDLVRLGSGWHVIEVEVTEPSLFLDYASPDANDRLVTATIARLA